MITNSFTAASMASAFTGQLPSQLEPKGIGWGGCYFKKTEDEKKIWNNKFIFNNFYMFMKNELNILPKKI